MNQMAYRCRTAVWFVLLTGLLLIAGCAPTAQNSSRPATIAPDENVLRVGVSTNLPPLIFKQNNEIVGLEAEFARELAGYLGKSLHFVELNWKDQIQALLDNRIDIIMSGMSVTPLREVRVAFTLSYFESGQLALIRRKDAARFGTGLFSMANAEAIGAIKDTTGAYYVERQFSNVKRKLYKNSRSAVKDLIKEEIDIFIHDAPMILYLASENETRGLTVLFALLTKEPLAWAVRKNNPELLKSANDFLQSFNEQGKLNQLIKYWIPFAK